MNIVLHNSTLYKDNKANNIYYHGCYHPCYNNHMNIVLHNSTKYEDNIHNHFTYARL